MGQHEYGLKSLADDQLLSGLARIVHRRNQITAEFLAYLAELDARELFLDLGFYPFGYREARSSLFEYCVVKLGLCESTAGRHIAAARVCRNHPEVFAMVTSGALHASALSLVRKHLTPENAGELFELCSRQSTRKVEELLAARFPRADVRDLVRRLPTRSQFTLNVECAAKQARMAGSAHAMSAELTPPAEPKRDPRTELAKAPVESLELGAADSVEASKSHGAEPASFAPRAAETPEQHRMAPGAARLSAESSKRRRLEPLSEDRYGVHFTADGEFCALLERVRGLAGHRLPSGDLLTLLKHGLEAYERELEKERFAVSGRTRRSRSAAPAPATLSTSKAPAPASSAGDLSAGDSTSLPSTSGLVTRTPTQSAPQPKPNPGRKWKRYYPAAVVRAVFLRDENQCTYVSPDGRRCSACRFLELDHIEPWAVGGEATAENLRLRCRAHNQRYARQYFGVSRVNAAIQLSRRRREVLLGRNADPSETKRCAERLGQR